MKWSCHVLRFHGTERTVDRRRTLTCKWRRVLNQWMSSLLSLALIPILIFDSIFSLFIRLLKLFFQDKGMAFTSDFMTWAHWIKVERYFQEILSHIITKLHKWVIQDCYGRFESIPFHSIKEWTISFLRMWRGWATFFLAETFMVAYSFVRIFFR